MGRFMVFPLAAAWCSKNGRRMALAAHTSGATWTRAFGTVGRHIQLVVHVPSYRDDFTREEAEEFVVTSLTLAMARDGSSGGIARTVTITASGVEKRFIPCKELALQWDEGAPQYARGVVV